MTYSKKIIALIIFSSFVCLSYLAYTEKNQQDYNYGKSWWTAYFALPQENDLSFVIENHSKENSFHWEVLIDKNPVSKGDAVIQLGEKKTIPVAQFTNENSNKITIKITSTKSSQELYKTF